MTLTPSARPAHRSGTDRWIAGVSGGLAEHTGQPAWLFRAGFVVGALIGGVGVVAYVLMWLFLPAGAPRASTSRPVTGLDTAGLLGVVALGLGTLMALSLLGASIRVSLWAPIILLGGGVLVLLRQGDEARRVLAQPPGSVGGSWVLTDRSMWLRMALGAGLLILGLVGVIVPRIDLGDAVQALLAASALVAGLVVLALPWLAAWARRLQAERFATIRAEERAAMAARVHDSVLQTLTLIQRRADDPREVARLARAEERALRSWLYAPTSASGTLGAALAEVVATTEADYDARIDLVTVGDLAVDDRVAGLVAATREAVVNAAKHAGAPARIYAEVADGQVEVTVKDRGVGFDPDAIGGDRHGVRQSIVARVQSLGGTADVRTAPGEGTEIRLVLPVDATPAPTVAPGAPASNPAAPTALEVAPAPEHGAGERAEPVPGHGSPVGERR